MIFEKKQCSSRLTSYWTSETSRNEGIEVCKSKYLRPNRTFWHLWSTWTALDGAKTTIIQSNKLTQVANFRLTF